MDFVQAEALFRHLREEHHRGTINGDTFETQVSRIQVVDPQGRQWMIGVRSGNWYYLDDKGEWTPGDPLAKESSETRCLQCGRPLELGKGICDACIAEAVAQTQLDEGVKKRLVSNDTETRYRDGIMHLAFTVLGLVVICASLFAFQTTASKWTPLASSSGLTMSPAVVATYTEAWPPSPLPTVTPGVYTSSVRISGAASLPTVPPVETPTPVPTLIPVLPSPLPLVPLPSPTVQPSVAKLSGHLIFSLFDEKLGTYDIYSATVEGGSSRQQIVRQASQPDASVNGQLVYRSWDSSSRGLMISTLDGGEPRRLIGYGEAARPMWSSDGKVVLFYSLQDSDRKARVYRATSDGSFEVVKRGDTTVFGEVPSWLPDGRFVAKFCEDGRCGLYVMSLGGVMTYPLTTDTSDTAPASAPNGRQVAFMSHRDGNWEIYVVGTDGQGLLRLTNALANDGLPTWSPDGRYLAFVSDRDGEWAIWVIRPDGTDERKLFALGGSPEGRVRSAQSYESRGWIDERLCWIP